MILEIVREAVSRKIMFSVSISRRKQEFAKRPGEGESLGRRKYSMGNHQREQMARGAESLKVSRAEE